MTFQNTHVIKIEHPLTDRQLAPAAAALRNGRLVAFPTETVYGLGANALDPQAVAEIFSVKGRPADNPLIVHVASPKALVDLVRTSSDHATRLLDAFSPGPLTLVLPKGPMVPDLVTAGLDSVAVRIPAHPTARRLIEMAGIPVAAPSANRSGRPSPTRAWHVIEDLSGRIPYIIDDGPCEVGLESTVLDLTGVRPVILRPGAITAKEILVRTGIVVAELSAMHINDQKAPRSPGMKYRHYAPNATVLLATGEDCRTRAASVCRLLKTLREQTSQLESNRIEREHPFRIGLFSCSQTRELAQLEDCQILPTDVLNTGETAKTGSLCYYVDYAHNPDPVSASSRLFAALRRFDRFGVDWIIAETLPRQDMGEAYMNRLAKAAGGGIDPEEVP